MFHAPRRPRARDIPLGTRRPLVFELLRAYDYQRKAAQGRRGLPRTNAWPGRASSWCPEISEKEHRMLYIVVLAITLMMAGGSIVYVWTGHHSGRSK